VLVERGGAMHAEPLHDGEARAVDDREVLIRKRLACREGRFEIGGGDELDGGSAASQGSPEVLSRSETETVREQEPRFDDDVVAGDEPLTRTEDLLRTGIAPVSPVGCGVEDRGVDEERQCLDSTASPTNRCLSRAMSAPPESPR
jgi:hypothetical protein